MNKTKSTHQSRKASIGSANEYRSLSYKAFSPVLSGNSLSAKHLINNPKNDTGPLDDYIRDGQKMYMQNLNRTAYSRGDS
jgi:hypothetical protein